jgi:hypothetical protein
MRLFGYTERTFEKNTKAFKRELEIIIDICSANPKIQNRIYSRLIGILEISEVLNDSVTYHRGRGRDYKAIDAEIEKLLRDMRDDAVEKNIVALTILSDLLRRVISNDRSDGTLTHTEEKIEAYHYLADALQQMYDLSAKLEDIRNEQAKILEISQDALPSQRLQFDLYCDKLEQEKRAINERIEKLYAQYVYAINFIGRGKTISWLDRLDLIDVLDFKKFEKKIDGTSHSFVK